MWITSVNGYDRADVELAHGGITRFRAVPVAARIAMRRSFMNVFYPRSLLWPRKLRTSSSPRFIDHLCPDAFGLENELNGFADCAVAAEGSGNVVCGLFYFGDGIAHGNGEADTAH